MSREFAESHQGQGKVKSDSWKFKQLVIILLNHENLALFTYVSVRKKVQPKRDFHLLSLKINKGEIAIPDSFEVKDLLTNQWS